MSYILTWSGPENIRFITSFPTSGNEDGKHSLLFWKWHPCENSQILTIQSQFSATNCICPGTSDPDLAKVSCTAIKFQDSVGRGLPPTPNIGQVTPQTDWWLTDTPDFFICQVASTEIKQSSKWCDVLNLVQKSWNFSNRIVWLTLRMPSHLRNSGLLMFSGRVPHQDQRGESSHGDDLASRHV